MKFGHRLRLACLVLLVSSTPGSGEEPDDVRVINFPELQTVQGTVEINKPATNTNLVWVTEKVVAPANPEETANLVLSGTLDASGFRSAVLSIAGQVKSNYPGEGAIGALLVPAGPLFKRAFEEDGEALLSMRVDAAVQPGPGAYFAATHPRLDLAFPSYKVYFFNTTGQPASVTLFAYLAN